MRALKGLSRNRNLLRSYCLIQSNHFGAADMFKSVQEKLSRLSRGTFTPSAATLLFLSSNSVNSPFGMILTAPPLLELFLLSNHSIVYYNDAALEPFFALSLHPTSIHSLAHSGNLEAHPGLSASP